MSIDQQSRSATNRSETEAQQQAGSNESAKKRAIDLSPSQVLGGALAAMTAAAIGSRLGAAGTIIGAAAASVVAAVAGAVYTASLRHTHAKVRTVWSGRSSSGIPATVEAISDRADATAAKAQELGGSLTMTAMDVEGIGRIAGLIDPWGAVFNVAALAP